MVKARDGYGQVMSAVHRAQDIKYQESMSRPDTPMDLTGKLSEAVINVMKLHILNNMFDHYKTMFKCSVFQNYVWFCNIELFNN